jgi:hypothetical protein
VVAAAFVLAALPAPAQAAGCAWTFSGLPDHQNLRHERVNAISPDGAVIIGDATTPDANATLKGVLWFGATAADMGDQNWGPSVDNATYDVNNAGVVAGYTYDNDTGRTRSYRFHEGVYEWLRAPGGVNGVANFINERGDVVGWLQDVDGGNEKTVLWRAGTVRPEVIGKGIPAGFDEAGHVVTSEGRIWSLDGTSVRIRDLRGAHPTHYADGHAVGVNGAHQIIEWNLDGAVTRVIENATTVEAVNSNGVVAGLHAVGEKRSWAIWTDGEPQDVDGYVAGITDSGTAYGQRGWDAVIYTCR